MSVSPMRPAVAGQDGEREVELVARDDARGARGTRRAARSRCSTRRGAACPRRSRAPCGRPRRVAAARRCAATRSGPRRRARRSPRTRGRAGGSRAARSVDTSSTKSGAPTPRQAVGRAPSAPAGSARAPRWPRSARGRGPCSRPGRRGRPRPWRWPRPGARTATGRAWCPPCVTHVRRDGRVLAGRRARVGRVSTAGLARLRPDRADLRGALAHRPHLRRSDGADCTQRTSAPSSRCATARVRRRRARAAARARAAVWKRARRVARERALEHLEEARRAASRAPRGAASMRQSRMASSTASCPLPAKSGLPRSISVSTTAVGEEVGAVVERLAGDLLGREVGELALEHRRCRRSASWRGSWTARDAEVAELHPPVGRQVDVRRRDVAVDDAHRLPARRRAPRARSRARGAPRARRGRRCPRRELAVVAASGAAAGGRGRTRRRTPSRATARRPSHARAEDLDHVLVVHGRVERRLALEHRAALGVRRRSAAAAA